MIEISFNDAVRTARQIAVESPRHVDHVGGFNGENGCLAGKVLFRLGMVEKFSKQAHCDCGSPGCYGTGGIVVNTPVTARSYGLINCDDQTMDFLTRLMNRNDVKCEWGKAVRYAEKENRELFGIRAADPKEEEKPKEEKEKAKVNWAKFFLAPEPFFYTAPVEEKPKEKELLSA